MFADEREASHWKNIEEHIINHRMTINGKSQKIAEKEAKEYIENAKPKPKEASDDSD